MTLDTLSTSVGVFTDVSVRTGRLAPDAALPLVVTPAADRVDLGSWLQEHAAPATLALERDGGLLFRGFEVDSPEVFQRIVVALTPQVLDYTERSTPRQRVSDKVYTSTEYPADQAIPLHNENSYQHSWPRHIWFYCQHAAPSGGATPIADGRRVWHEIDPAVRDRFVEKKVMYLRNYSASVGLPWREAFQTDDRKTVETYCERHGIEYEWRDRDRLRTRQVRQAMAVHPVTGESAWFNQAHLFHVSSLPVDLRRALLAVFTDVNELPRQSFYGTGEPIEPETIDHIQGLYARLGVVFPWRNGDVLLLDNMLVAHGRMPFTGPRRVLVSMATPSA